MVVETAKVGQAGFIVTGDKVLLALKIFQDITILSPSDFLEHLEGEATDG